MIKNSRFAKVAVSAGLIVASGAAVLGITSFASAQLAADRGAQVATSDTIPTDSGAQVATSDTVPGDSADVGSRGAVGDDSRPEGSIKPMRFDRLKVIADTLGMSESDLVAALKDGKSIADVAKDKNVDLDKVIDALVKEFKAHLDEEVKSGEHTQEEADVKLAEFKTRLDDMVNGVRPPRGRDMEGPSERS